MEFQYKFVAVKPNGEICGPIGDSEAFVKKALIIGYKNAGPVFVVTQLSNTEIWHEILETGYTIRKAKIYLVAD